MSLAQPARALHRVASSSVVRLAMRPSSGVRSRSFPHRSFSSSNFAASSSSAAAVSASPYSSGTPPSSSAPAAGTPIFLQQQQQQPSRFQSYTAQPIRGHHGEWPSPASVRGMEDCSSPDNHFEHNQIVPEGTAGPDFTNRGFNYAFLGTTKFLLTSIPRVTVYKFAASWSATADVVALSTVEVDLSEVKPGDTVTVSWRGKPVFIRNRRQAEIDKENQVEMGSLRDPEADSDRHQDPKWVVVLGICTHLGCVPISNAGGWGGWFCPCHGSHYDTSGRIRKGPAPTNMEVPTYKFLSETKVLLG